MRPQFLASKTDCTILLPAVDSATSGTVASAEHDLKTDALRWPSIVTAYSALPVEQQTSFTTVHTGCTTGRGLLVTIAGIVKSRSSPSPLDDVWALDAQTTDIETTATADIFFSVFIKYMLIIFILKFKILTRSVP